MDLQHGCGHQRTSHAPPTGRPPPAAFPDPISGLHSAGIKEAMIKGQGRWGLYAQRPTEMIHYYRQALLAEILLTTNI